MEALFSALSQHAFLQTAVVTALLASIGCGVMGTYVVYKRIAFLAGGIAHSVLGGMGAAFYFGLDPRHGALPAVAAALLIGWVRLHWRAQEDTLISALWSIGMAIGVLFIAEAPGYQADLMSSLFGNILLVPRESVWFMIALDMLLLTIVAIYHRQFLAVVFDEEFARLRGIPVDYFYLLLLVLVAVTVVLLIQVVGLILVLALLTLPAAVAGHYVHSLGRMMLIATLLGEAVSVAGLALSYGPDLPVGPPIILLAGAVYVVSATFRQVFGRRRAQLAAAQGLSQGALRE
jgi:zinc transport system permease protein